jgi:predicted kinase
MPTVESRLEREIWGETAGTMMASAPSLHVGCPTKVVQDIAESRATHNLWTATETVRHTSVAWLCCSMPNVSYRRQRIIVPPLKGR